VLETRENFIVDPCSNFPFGENLCWTIDFDADQRSSLHFKADLLGTYSTDKFDMDPEMDLAPDRRSGFYSIYETNFFYIFDSINAGMI
jgi:hypothetical protein